MIKILQVSDFHFVNDPDGINFQKLLLRKAKEEFAKIEKNKKLLVITGDFHFWNETDYDKSLKYIRALVGAMDIEMNSDVFLVPGNHDVCSSEDDLQAIGQKSIVEMVKNDHKALHDKGEKNLPRLLTRFEKYSKFCTDLGIYTDASLPATVHVRSWGNRVNFIHLNTCLIADGVEKNNQLLDTTLKAHIEKGTALLLIDGLDEIGSERGRKRFIEHLNDFIKNNPKLNVIITSREKGFSIISEGAFNDFTTFRIDNLDKDGINTLCSKWFSLVYGESERVKKNKDELVNRIIYDKRIRQLATNPLMLTTLLLVDHNTNSLPTKRVGLYYEATKVLLDTWKKDEYTDSLKIDHDQAKNQLAYVAFQMTTNRKKYKNKIREDELKTLLNNVRDECSNLVSRNGLSVGEVISIIQQRSALIAKTEDVKLDDGHYESVYEFMHPTFQEYLAAYAVSV